MTHILIVGRNGVGKSTLIRALLASAKAPVYGVITEKTEPMPDGSRPVCIRRFGEPKRFSEESCVGLCRDGGSVAFPAAFDRFAQRLALPYDGVIVFDELGFMESDAQTFRAAVLKTLDQAPFVIAAVRDRQTAFLDAVRSHPRAKVFRIDESNRDDLRERLLRMLPELAPGLF